MLKELNNQLEKTIQEIIKRGEESKSLKTYFLQNCKALI